MSRKSSWWLRPQRKGASNRAALNEAKYFMEHSKVLRERINELAAENDKLRESLEYANNEWEKDSLEYLNLQAENAKLRELCVDLYDYAAFSINYFGDMCGILPRMRELGVVDR